MAIHTQQSLSGFIASDPQLSFAAHGDARFYTRSAKNITAATTTAHSPQLDSTFHDLVQYRRAAEHSYAAFNKGDKFIAEGYTREYHYELDGQPQHGEEFVAKSASIGSSSRGAIEGRSSSGSAPFFWGIA